MNSLWYVVLAVVAIIIIIVMFMQPKLLPPIVTSPQLIDTSQTPITYTPIDTTQMPPPPTALQPPPTALQPPHTALPPPDPCPTNSTWFNGWNKTCINPHTSREGACWTLQHDIPTLTQIDPEWPDWRWGCPP